MHARALRPTGPMAAIGRSDRFACPLLCCCAPVGSPPAHSAHFPVAPTHSLSAPTVVTLATLTLRPQLVGFASFAVCSSAAAMFSVDAGALANRKKKAKKEEVKDGDGSASSGEAEAEVDWMMGGRREMESSSSSISHLASALQLPPPLLLSLLACSSNCACS